MAVAADGRRTGPAVPPKGRRAAGGGVADQRAADAAAVVRRVDEQAADDIADQGDEGDHVTAVLGDGDLGGRHAAVPDDPGRSLHRRRAPQRP